MIFTMARNRLRRGESSIPKKAFMRRMVWIKTARTETWACSECAWRFNPSGPPRGGDLDEMKRNYERQRDTEYAAHVCAKYPRAPGA